MDRRAFVLGSLSAVVGASAFGMVAACSGGSSSSDGGTTRRYGDLVLRRRAPSSSAPNVLFISLDDCNDWLGFLANHPGTHTPNLDALAAESLVFSKAYCTVPICRPSRAAVMFGRPAYETGVYDHSEESRSRYDEMKRETPSLVDHLWAAGYDAFGAGKIFPSVEPERWTEVRRTDFYTPGADRDRVGDGTGRFDPEWISPYDGDPIGDGERFTSSQIDFGPSGVEAAQEPDGEAVEWIVDALDGAHERPFLLGLGFVLPHEPWRLPQRFFDRHPLDDVVVPEYLPDDIHDLGEHARTLIDPQRRYRTLRRHRLVRKAVQAYQAAISFVDDRVGILLDALASSPYADDTIVAIWSDHGYHLGEKLHVDKMTLWEPATHVPLLLRVPGRFDDGSVVDRPVSTIDLGPTIAELCGVEPSAPREAQSLLPLVADPAAADSRPPIMTWRRGNHAVRRGDWRFIRYANGESELYDHSIDPDEIDNLAGDPAYAEIERELAAFLPDGGAA